MSFSDCASVALPFSTTSKNRLLRDLQSRPTARLSGERTPNHQENTSSTPATRAIFSGGFLPILGGNLYCYRVSAPMRLTLAIRRVAGEWQIGEVKGCENALPTQAAMTALKTWLGGQHVADPQADTQSRR